MTAQRQSSLFGDDGMQPPSQNTLPDVAVLRVRLAGVLSTLQSAAHMPWSERDLRMWQIVVPNMTKWLPEDEAQHVRALFAAEVQRLTQGTEPAMFASPPYPSEQPA